MDRVVAAAVSLVLAFTVQLLIRMARDLWWKPLQQMNHFQCHAITGPPYKLLFGNTKEMRIMARESRSKPMPLCHQILPRVLPHYTTWTQMFGKDYVHWFGPTPRLNVEDPKQMKQILSDRLGYFGKTRRDPLVRNLAGNHGITRADGEKWAQHRRILTPAFYMDNLNGMIPAMISSVGNMLDSWLKSITSGKNEIEVLKDFCSLSADVIARTAFGVSYIEGKRIFDLQAEQAVLVVEALQSVYVPGLRFLPTKKNRYRWKLKREIERSFKQLIEGREHSLCRGRSDSYGNDLLGIMMDANKAEVQQGRKAYQRLSRDEIIDDCKTFFFAGRETTSSLLTWTMVLLGMHPTWQDRARKEVIEICGHDPPSSQNINRLKIVKTVEHTACCL